MKKIVILSAILVLAAAVSVFAAPRGGDAGLTIDGSVVLASETASGSGAGFGVGFGASYDLSSTLRLSASKLLARADFNYVSGSQDFLGATLDSSRMPIFMGARYVLPLGLPVDLFAEGGIELSFDKFDVAIPVFVGPFLGTIKQSVSQTNLGFVPGFGVKFPLGNNLSVGVDARFHIISNNYSSFLFSFGYSF